MWPLDGAVALVLVKTSAISGGVGLQEDADPAAYLVRKNVQWDS